MNKRYQVFVSSTYEDLQVERQEVMQALLELDCIPAGMELFPAANEDQWTLIKKVIDDCDYYIVVIGGRYGSLGSAGVSYTEMEYRYALEKDKPIIAFVHKSPETLPANRTEQIALNKKKLKTFNDFVKRKTVKYWDTPENLGSMVSRSLIMLIKNNPAIGWIRADQIVSESSAKEILLLKKKIEELETSQLSETQAPQSIQEFAQGEDKFEIRYKVIHNSGENRETEVRRMQTTWNEIFSAIAPLMMVHGATEFDIKHRVAELVSAAFQRTVNVNSKARKQIFHSMLEDDFETIKIQLRALTLITPGTKLHGPTDPHLYWKLTRYGENMMNKLRAIKKLDISSQ